MKSTAAFLTQRVEAAFEGLLAAIILAGVTAYTTG